MGIKEAINQLKETNRNERGEIVKLIYNLANKELVPNFTATENFFEKLYFFIEITYIEKAIKDVVGGFIINNRVGSDILEFFNSDELKNFKQNFINEMLNGKKPAVDSYEKVALKLPITVNKALATPELCIHALKDLRIKEECDKNLVGNILSYVNNSKFIEETFSDQIGIAESLIAEITYIPDII